MSSLSYGKVTKRGVVHAITATGTPLCVEHWYSHSDKPSAVCRNIEGALASNGVTTVSGPATCTVCQWAAKDE